MDTKMQTKEVVWGNSKILGGNIPRVSRTEGQQNTGGTCMPRSCAHADRDPPKYSVAQVIGYIKGKSAIAIAQTYRGKRQNFTGDNF
jgi:putative transposase